MSELLEKIDEVLLMGPGPSCVHPEVYAALSRPTLGHMDAQFLGIMDEVKEQLRHVFGTCNSLTLPMSGTGSAGMEACFVNLIEKGDRVLVLVNGVFGKRMEDVAARLGAEVDSLEFEWGTPVLAEAVGRKLAGKKYKIIAMVHAETSTGVCNPAQEIGGLARSCGALYLLDTVTSLGGMEVAIDKWVADAVYSGTQKCLSCPPGLAPCSFSGKAVAAIRERKSKVPNWYLDLSMIMNYWEGNSRVYHHTAPINMVYALSQALSLLLGEGLGKVQSRHMACHLELISGLEKLGLRMLVAPQCRLPMLNSVVIPDGADDLAVRKKLRSDFKIEIGAGLGPLAGKIWRIGLMGHAARKENVARVIDALAKCL